jgi:hypothetical protein
MMARDRIDRAIQIERKLNRIRIDAAAWLDCVLEREAKGGAPIMLIPLDRSARLGRMEYPL